VLAGPILGLGLALVQYAPIAGMAAMTKQHQPQGIFACA